MKEIKGSLWRYYDKKGYMILITTNGFIRKDGMAVMGRGCAEEAARRFPDLPRQLGVSLKKYGNVVRVLFPLGQKTSTHHPESQMITFPVKHNWFENADPELIKQSATALKEIAENSPDVKFVLPRPGCGNGKLDWEDVRPLIADLPDNVLVISKYREGKWQ